MYLSTGGLPATQMPGWILKCSAIHDLLLTVDITASICFPNPKALSLQMANGKESGVISAFYFYLKSGEKTT